MKEPDWLKNVPDSYLYQWYSLDEEGKQVADELYHHYLKKLTVDPELVDRMYNSYPEGRRPIKAFFPWPSVDIWLPRCMHFVGLALTCPKCK